MQDGFEMEILVFAVPGESSEKVGRCGEKDPHGALLRQGCGWVRERLDQP